MAIKTLETWTYGIVQPKSITETMANELARLKAAGLTSGLHFEIDGVIKRTWATHEAAQGWLDFLKSLDVKLDSAVVAEE